MNWCRFNTIAVSLVVGVVIGIPVGVWLAWREGA